MRSVLFVAVLIVLLISESRAVTSLSVLKGDNFRDDLGYPQEKTTLTIENFSLWEYGAMYFFYDITEPIAHDDGTNSEQTYSNQFFGSLVASVSLSKVTDKKVSWGIIKDFSIRLEMENASGDGAYNFQHYLYGLQYDLEVGGFDLLGFYTIVQDNPQDEGVGFRLGGYWQIAWDYGRWKRFKFMGFVKTAPWDGDRDPENPVYEDRGSFFLTQPQLLYDVGYGLWGKPDRFEMGLEYSYAINAFQQAGKDEKVLQYMLKASY